MNRFAKETVSFMKLEAYALYLKGDLIMKKVMEFMDNHTGTVQCSVGIIASVAIAIMYKKYLDRL